MTPTPSVRLESLVDAQLRRTPDAPAVVDHSGALTYAEVDRRSRATAAALAAAGVRPGDRVGIALRRSRELPPAVLAVLRLGAAYVPLDPEYPASRLTDMAEQSRLACIIVDTPARPSWLAEHVPLHAVTTQEPRDEFDAAGGLTVDGEAYVIFTSGSTGRPKGVVMPHRPLTELVRWHKQHRHLGSAARTLQFTPLSFDVSFQEILTTWATGGCLVTVDEQTRRDPFALAEFLAQHRVERLFLPFVALEGLCQAICRIRPKLPALRDVITAGEQLRITPAVREAFAEHLDARLHNHYGPSETHVVTAHTLGDHPVDWPVLPPIGRAVGAAELHVVGDKDQPVAPGQEGLLLVGGHAVADGYAGRPDLTAERFPVVPGLGRVYRTGDVVRVLPGGDLEFLGRRDHQVKIRGFRVELGEVEAALAESPAVAQVAVVAERLDNGSVRLVAHVAPTEATEFAEAALRAGLIGRLPEYMLPDRIVVHTRLPLTPSGKVDRNGLAAAVPAGPKPASGQRIALESDDVTAAVIHLLRELLDRPDADPADGFVVLGGDSVSAVHAVTEVMDRFGIRMPVTALLTAASIEDFAREVDKLQAR